MAELRGPIAVEKLGGAKPDARSGEKTETPPAGERQLVEAAAPATAGAAAPEAGSVAMIALPGVEVRPGTAKALRAKRKGERDDEAQLLAEADDENADEQPADTSEPPADSENNETPDDSDDATDQETGGGGDETVYLIGGVGIGAGLIVAAAGGGGGGGGGGGPPPNQAPVAVADSYTTNEDTALVVAAAGVLANDTDGDNNPLTAALVAGPANGTLTLNANGSFTYTPNANYAGTDSFTYRANDGTANGNTVTVSLTVTAVNDAPVAVADSYSTNEDTPLVVAAAGVLANDSDVDGNALTAALVTGPANGTLTLNANGSFTYTPNANYAGTDSFTYRANDGTANGNTVTVSLTVNAVNDAPLAVADSYTTNEDTALVVAAAGVLTNDSDVEGSALTAALVAGPANGTLTLNANGSFTYTPNADYNGADSFTYRANDGTANGNTVTVSLTVNPVNDAPVAVADSYSTNEDTALVVAAAGVLANDADADGNPLTAALVAGPANGVLTLNANGSFTYTPNADFNGADSFTYRANDGTIDGNTVTVNLTVNPVNDAPVAVGESYSTNEDTALVIAAPGVLANDSDIDGNDLTAVLVSGPANGTLALNANGSFTYTPNANYNGADSFTYRASDGAADGNTVTVSLTVNPVNDAPLAVADSYATNEEAALVVAAAGVLANDSDVDGNALTATLVSGPANGVLVFNADGSFTYTPNANYAGGDSFTYRANDGTVDGNTVTVSLTVNAVNDAPVAAADSYSTNEDVALVVAAAGVLANDGDVDGDALTAALVTGPANGNLTLNPDGSFTYTPNANYNGADSFTYKVNDGTVDGNTVTVSLTVNAVNDAPVAVADSYGTNEDTALVVAAAGVLLNDSDVEGNALTAALVTGPANGALTLNADGSFTYTPDANYSGADSFTYRANDGTADGNTVTVDLTVIPVNDAPVAVADAYSTNEDTVLNVAAAGVLANDSDAEGNAITAVLQTGPANGVLVFNANGSFSYTPNANYNGTDSFTYTASDGTFGNIVTVNLTVNAVNDAPVAVADSYTTNEDTQFILVAPPGVLFNDSDIEGSPLTASLVTGPANGILIFNSDGTFGYTPNANFNGTDSFTYRANDGTVSGNTVTVTLTVNPVQDAPVAVADIYVAPEDATFNVSAASGVLANDSDPDGNPLTAVLVTGPANATAFTLNPDGSFSYTPNANFDGADSFTYKANDGTADSNTVTVSLSIAPQNDAPVAVADSYSTNEETVLNVAAAAGVLANDTDVEGNPLTAVLVSGPSFGFVTLNADGSFSYSPHPFYSGPDSFTYRANDGTANSNTVTVSLTVIPVNDVPVAADDSYSTNEDTVLNVAAPGVLANDFDQDFDPKTAILVTNPGNASAFTFNSDGSFSYTPNANFAGSDAFTYKVNDGTVDGNTVTVNLSVTGVNDAPVAVADNYATNEDTVLNVAAAGVLANDSDVEGGLTAVLVTGPANASAFTLNSDGSFSYTPSANFAGADSFTYKVNDGTVDGNTVTVSLTVNAVNDVPVAAADNYATNEDTVLNVAAAGVLVNDSDVEGGLTAVLVTGPANASAFTLSADGSFSYTPTANFAGGDSFTYKVNDGTVDGNTVTVSLTVNAVNDAPVNTVPGTQTVNEDASVTLSTGNGNAIQVADVDATTLTVTLTVLHGTLTLASTAGLSFGTGDGSLDTTMTFSGTAAAINTALGSGLTYTPNANFNGSDSIAVLVTDNGQTGSGGALTDSDSVTINITAINDAPVVSGDGTESATAINEDAPGAGQTIGALFSGQYSDAADNQIPSGGASSPGAFSGIAVTANGSSAGTGQWQYFSGGVWTDIGAVSDAAAKLFGDPSVTLLRFNPVADFNGAAPTLTVHLIDNSLPFAITNGQVVDISGVGATGGTTAYSSGTVVLSQTVTAVNDAPVAVADSYNAVMDTPLVVAAGAGVLFNDSDVDANTLSSILVTDVANGTLALSADGSFTYTPGAGYVGPDSFTYKVNDGTVDGNTVTVSLTVASPNAAPTLDLDGDDSNTVGTGYAASFTEGGAPVLITDGDTAITDADVGDMVEGATVAIQAALAGDQLVLGPQGGFVVTGSGTGTITITGTGTAAQYAAMLELITFSNSSDEPGASRTINVTVTDGTATSNVAVSTIGITQLNDAPTLAATGGTPTFTEGSGAVDLFSTVTASTIEAGQTFTSLALTVSNVTDGASEILTFDGSDVALTNNNSVTTATNGLTVNVSVAAGMATVEFAGASLSAAALQALVDALAYRNVSENPTDADRAVTIFQLVDSGLDGGGNSNNSNPNLVATVNVDPVNDPPAANDDVGMTSEDSALVVNAASGVLSNDTDADDALTVSAVTGGTVGTPFALTHGTLDLEADGSYVYTPTGAFVALRPGDTLTDSFTYTASDGTLADTATVTITINGANEAPVAVDDAFGMVGNTPITFAAADLLGNDTDPDQPVSGLSIQSVSGAVNGTVSLNAGVITFTPTAGYEGAASFNYTLQDADGGTDTGTVNLTVTDPIWYIDSQNGSDVTGDGTYANPFATMAPISGGSSEALDDANDTIFIYDRGTTYVTGIVLEAGQKLYGDSFALTANGLSIGASANNTSIQYSGVGITLATDNTIVGLNLTGTANGAIGIEDGGGSVTTASGTLTIDNTSIMGSGNAIDIDQGGNLNVTLDTLSSQNSTTVGVQLAGTASSGTGLISGTFSATAGTIQTANSHSFQIGSGAASSGGTIAVDYDGRLENSITGSAANISNRLAGSGDIRFDGDIVQDGSASTITDGIVVTNVAAGNIFFTGATKLIDMTGSGDNAISVTGNSGAIVNFSGGALNLDTDSGHGFAISQSGGQVNVSTAADIDASTTGRGISISSSTGGAVNFTGGNLTVSTNSGDLLHSNNAAIGSSLTISGSGNTLTTTSGQLVDIANTSTSGITFDSMVQSGGTIVNDAISINNLDGGIWTTGTISVLGTLGLGNDGIIIEGGSSTTFNLGNVTIGQSGDDGIELNGANGAVTATSVLINNSMNGQGIEIVNATNAVTINGGNIGNADDPALDAVLISGGTGAVTIAANLTKTSAGNVVEVNGHGTGAISFSGAISATGGVNNGIALVNNSSGNIAFTGNVTLNTGGNTAFNFTNTGATGANVSLTEGSLDIDTTSGTGINATNTTIGAGSLTISGATGVGNIVTSTTGRAINIDGVTANVTLNEVNVTGGGTTTGVFLQNTGAGGQFVVTGDSSTAGSGGTIANIGGVDVGNITGAATTGTGIFMNNVANVSLSNMTFSGTFENFGIRGNNVNNFTLRDSFLTGTFGDNNNFDEGTIRFGSQNGADGGSGTTGLRGTALFEGNTISGGNEDNLAVYVYGSDTLNITVRDNATSGDQAVFGLNNTANGNDGFYLESGGTTNVTTTVTGVEFQGARGDMLQTIASGSTTQTTVIQNNTFINAHTNQITGGGGIALTGGGTNINVDYLVDNNIFRGQRASAIFSSFGGVSGNISGLVTNNTQGTANSVYDTSQANRGSMEGMFFFGGIDAKQLGSTGNVNYALRIDNNTIRDVNGVAGILLRSNQQDTGGQARLEATISNNTMAEMGPNVAGGVYLQPGGSSLNNDEGTLGLNMSNNNINFTIGGASASGDAVVFDQAGVPATFYMPGYTSAPSADPNTLATFLKTTKGNVFTNAEVSGTGGVLSNTGAVANQAFVLTVPTALAPGFATGWEELAASGTATSLITLAELGVLVEAAIERWSDAGATAEQIEAMRAVDFDVLDLDGVQVGTGRPGLIEIDRDGAGFGWFVDATPGDDSEFVDGIATADGGAAGKLDALTVVMHELGHQIGLDDSYASGEDELMHGYMTPGERHVPTATEVAAATDHSLVTGDLPLTQVRTGDLEIAGAPDWNGLASALDFGSSLTLDSLLEPLAEDGFETPAFGDFGAGSVEFAAAIVPQHKYFEESDYRVL